MGNVRSLLWGDESQDTSWKNVQNNCDSCEKISACQISVRQNLNDADSPSRILSEDHKEQVNEFKWELANKHEKRRQILNQKRREMEELREEVIRLNKENQQLRDSSRIVTIDSASEGSTLEIERLRKENEELKFTLSEQLKLLESTENILQKNRELRIRIAELQRELQDLNTDIVSFEKERQDYNAHVVALKDVITVSKQLLQIRESQLRELKQKINGIEESLAGREMSILSQDLRCEYERQLQNIRNLRSLYEERQTVERREKEELTSQLYDARREFDAEKHKTSELEERIKTLEEDNSKKYDEIKVLDSNLGLSKAECRQYQSELTVINQLFSGILLGFNNSQDVDLDKLQKHLEDHRDLLQDIVLNEISSEVSYALPKVLLDLLNEVNTTEKSEQPAEDLKVESKLDAIKEESESQTFTSHQMNSAEKIMENLPKVWKVLIELLSHQKAPLNNLTDNEENDNPCYKTVQTPKGPSLVLSVSQTFIRLKDLILEKKSLEKETSHLKQLNGHLENRLQDQEKRLGLVQTELSKTWLVVGKLQKQHQMLHTQEKILRYELAQKRKLLTELKEELEYSREKWVQAREKNSSTEQQWKQLRTEFASRRNTIINDDLNNSIESGYSDDRDCSSSDEDPDYKTDVTQCAQKILHGDEIEDILKVNDSQGVTALTNLVPSKMSCPEEVPGTSSSTNEVINSDLVQLRTEVAQHNSVENTNESTCLVEPRAETDVNSVVENSVTQQPSTSIPTLEDILARRDKRLKKLEGQAEQLVTKVTSTANRSLAISNRLDDLHDVYGQNTSAAASEAINQTNTNISLPAHRDEITLNSAEIGDESNVPSANEDVDSIFYNDNQE